MREKTRYYEPDDWVVVEVRYLNGDVERKVMAGWAGSYTSGRSWKLSSGITDETISPEKKFVFKNYSGSVYICDPNSYGLDWYTASMLKAIENDAVEYGAKVTLLAEYMTRAKELSC